MQVVTVGSSFGKVSEQSWAMVQLILFSMKADIWFASYKYINPVMKKNTMSITNIAFAKEEGA